MDDRPGLEGNLIRIDHLEKIILVDVFGEAPVDEILPFVRCPQVIDDDDIVDSFLVQFPDKGTADESGSAGDDNHEILLL